MDIGNSVKAWGGDRDRVEEVNGENKGTYIILSTRNLKNRNVIFKMAFSLIQVIKLTSRKKTKIMYLNKTCKSLHDDFLLQRRKKII